MAARYVYRQAFNLGHVQLVVLLVCQFQSKHLPAQSVGFQYVLIRRIFGANLFSPFQGSRVRSARPQLKFSSILYHSEVGLVLDLIRIFVSAMCTSYIFLQLPSVNAPDEITTASHNDPVH